MIYLIVAILTSIIPLIIWVYLLPANTMPLLVFYWTVMRHKKFVAIRMLRLSMALIWRALVHDLTKFLPSEAKGFAANIPGLKKVPYGGKDYESALSKDSLAESINHHYDRNRHHPQHFDDGIRAMNLIDLAEMLADWAAAAKYTPGGALTHSMNINRGRFCIDYSTYLILQSTAETYFRKDLA